MMSSTPDQLIDQTVRNQVYLERLKAKEVEEVNSFLEMINERVLLMLSRTDITTLTRKRLENQLRTIRELIDSDLGEYKAAWLSSMEAIADYEASFELDSLRRILVKAEMDSPTPTQIGAAVFTRPLQVEGASGGKLLADFFDDWAESSTDKVTGAIRIGYAQGQTNRQIQTAITGTIAAHMTDGTLGQIKRAAEGITRTAIQHVATQARNAVWERNKSIIKKVRWVSTLDKRTSSQCRSLDGMLFDIDKGPRPPAHYRCRSTTVAVLDDRYAFLDEGGTRRDRDPATGQVGYVDANETYYQWLKRQPKAFQDDIIGPKRGKLLRDGGLTADEFAAFQLNSRFEPITLEEMREEMRKKAPLAFERAGV